MKNERICQFRKVLLQVNNLKMYFPVKKKSFFQKQQYVKANDGINLNIYEGETLGLVGESGCGKSTFGRVLLQLYHQTEGEILYYRPSLDDSKNYEEIPLESLTNQEMRLLRKELQMVFQDPYSSLNPRMTVFQLIGEAVWVHGFVQKRSQLDSYVRSVMQACGLDDTLIDRYPHQFSGGQRQRIGIARSIALKPRFMVCDEAVSALDVSIQAQIINLLMELKRREKLTYLFISHDLGIVRYISDRIGVMYLGKLVELSDCEELFEKPLHPYTKVLLSSIPSMEKKREANRELLGELPSPIHTPSGCPFHPRCNYCTDECIGQVPIWREYSPCHWVACHYVE